ncbi:hypothetical protein [Diaminobutyricimonas sp. LJ205]|uniref:hypothetical protein n=1 Tax=Diaminobutyricimonas sp. LJ205 TaxID=2683590 RepID=UPI0012F50B3A|nr:hypothetical protein [Diaminobutyricimonas sp. LJ205]
MRYTTSDLRAYGFVGFVPFPTWSRADIITPGQSDVEGVYAVVREAGTVPEFTDDLRPAPRRRSRTAAEAADRWVANVAVLYFGMAPLRRASKRGTRTGLAQRIHEYQRHGLHGGSNHHGGKLIWQTGDPDALLVAWKVLPEGESRVVESALIAGFRQQMGRPPFANTGAPQKGIAPIFL